MRGSIETAADVRWLLQPTVRALVEKAVQSLIDALDAADRLSEEREPADEDEIVSEDDGVVMNMSAHVGRQA